jgi:ATP-dependent helicase/nuclease subunit B
MFYFKLDDPIVTSKVNVPDDIIEDEINKSFRMKGTSTSDINIIRKMDNSINGASFTIPVKINNDGSLSKSSSVLSEDDFDFLRKYLEKLIKDSCGRMLKGDIKAKPVLSGLNKACDYCPYSSICQFDPSLSGNSYNYLKKISDEDILLKIREEVHNG